MSESLGSLLREHFPRPRCSGARNIRRDANDAIKKLLKDKKIAEDEEKRALDEVLKLTDQTLAHLDEMSKNKEKEILTV